MDSAARADIHPRLGLRSSRRLLRLASDDRLVQQIQRGSEPAFEVAFERHAPAILGFCRHMLGSPEEAEDAVQHTFAAAFSDLQRGGEREIALKPWLFTIARNRCLSMLRARREHAAEDPELLTAGLAEQVEQRADLRQLLNDVRELPEEQREALLLAEVGGLPHTQIAAVLGCEVGRVKGLVFRARSALVARREARELACGEVREQLANLRGGALRRNELRLHLRDCAGCRDFREQVRQQRQLLAVALPVMPTLGLKSNVLAAVGIGGAGSAAAGGATVAGGAVGGAAGAGAFGGAAKVAAVAALAIGGVGGGAAVVVSEHHHAKPSSHAPATERPRQGAPADAAPVGAAPLTGSAQPSTRSSERVAKSHGVHRSHRGREVSAERSHGKHGEVERESHSGENNGRGPIDAPPDDTPVRRGPPEDKVKDPAKPERGPKAPNVVQDEPGATGGKDQAQGQGAGGSAGHGNGGRPEADQGDGSGAEGGGD